MPSVVVVGVSAVASHKHTHRHSDIYTLWVWLLVEIKCHTQYLIYDTAHREHGQVFRVVVNQTALDWQPVVGGQFCEHGENIATVCTRTRAYFKARTTSFEGSQ